MKLKFLLFFALAFIGVSAHAQFVTNWQNRDTTWIGTAHAKSPTFATGIAYNPITNKVYLSKRGIKIYILDPATGAKPATGPDSLITTGIAKSTLNSDGANVTSQFSFSKISVTSDGKIYASTIGTAVNTFAEIWYWSSETAVPEKIYSYTVTATSERLGDSFTAVGSGNDVFFYLGGASSSIMVDRIAKKDGVYKIQRRINLGATATAVAGGSISPISQDSIADFYISGSAKQKRLYQADGTRILSFSNAAALSSSGTATAGNLSSNFIGLKYFEVGSKKYIAVNGSATATHAEALALHIYDVTDATSTTPTATYIAGISMTGTIMNGVTSTSTTTVTNGLGQAAIDFKKTVNPDGSVTMQFFQVVNKNGFSSHTINFKADGTLPVSLSSFSASVKNNQNQLSWSTASESNNSGFEVESSQDGVVFSKVGFVPSQSSNSTSNLNYSFTDKLAQSGTTYYRLKQLDLDAKFTYSDVKVINNQLSGGITVYPNPAEDYVIVNGLDLPGVTVALFNSNGAEINTKGLIEGNKISLKGLKSGLYIVKVSKNGKLLQSSKLVKN